MKAYPSPFPVTLRDYTGDALLSLGRVVMLVHPRTFEYLARVSATLEGIHLDSDEILVRDYDEAGGCLASLEESGLVVRTGRSVSSGWVRFPVCRLTAKAMGQP